MKFRAIVIGDEIMSGRRQDKHMAKVIEILGARGLRLFSCEFIGDDSAQIVATLRRTFADDDIVFVFGGLGATPDDLTRECAAKAGAVALIRHPEAATEIVARFGDEAYPHRVAMADLPAGSAIIPNPVNRVPGFSFKNHHFLPGFPEMAWPMLIWVLDTIYPTPGNVVHEVEMAIRVNATENKLMKVMQELVADFPDLKLFSLPSIERRAVELGFKGKREMVELAMEKMKKEITELGCEWEEVADR